MGSGKKKPAGSVRPQRFRPNVVGTVTVPMVSAAELFAQTLETLEVTSVNDGFRGWDFFVDHAGRDLGYAGTTYEVAMWKKGKSGSMEGNELRNRFQELGYIGVVPALLLWLIEHQPRDALYATLPEERAKCHYTYNERSFVASPYHYRDRTGSRLYAITPPHKCSPGEIYLAFRQT